MNDKILINISLVLMFISAIIFIYLGEMYTVAIWKVVNYIMAIINISYVISFLLIRSDLTKDL